MRIMNIVRNIDNETIVLHFDHESETIEAGNIILYDTGMLAITEAKKTSYYPPSSYQHVTLPAQHRSRDRQNR